MTDAYYTKVCSKCGQEKTLDCFANDKYKKSGKKPSCKICCNKKYKEWHEKNRNYLLKKYKKYGVKNKNSIKLRKKIYLLNNKSIIMIKIKSYKNKKYNNCDLYKLKQNIRNLINQSIRKNKICKNLMSVNIIGCSWNQLKNHIEQQFQPEMSWENRSEWHIDHIIPLASAKTEEDVIRLNHFTNLRPLWAKDNLAKGAKMEHLI